MHQKLKGKIENEERGATPRL